MAQKNSTTSKPRRAARTLEEQIAELQAKAQARKEKAAAKAQAQLEVVEAQLAKARARVEALVATRAELVQQLGIVEDLGPTTVDETSQEG